VADTSNARGSAPAPSSTYRLQLHAGFTFADAADVVPYVASLGVSHLYLSPILQAAPGSTHGYDVVDHAQVSRELGGEDGLLALAEVANQHGLGIIVDVVPNHMAIPTPASLNAALWDVLAKGPRSGFASWFDVAWQQHGRSLLMPVLGARIGKVLDAGELTLDSTGEQPLLRYHEHAFPVRAGTEHLPLPELVDRQWYRLAHWRVADEELNYRRFFTIGTLVALRVEDPDVFIATHRTLLRLHADGVVDGFRIDHIDGLADPQTYLANLADAAPDAYVVVEKILADDEQLPSTWACAGTTGYDALRRIQGVFVDPAGAEPMAALWAAAAAPQRRDFADVADAAKREMLDTALRAEVARLTDLAHGICTDDITLRDVTRHRLEQALVEMLVAFPVYRAYVRPGEPADAAATAILDRVVTDAAARRPDLGEELDVLRALALGEHGADAGGPRAEYVVRFQQTCGPVMAKGVEDTAFYRWHRLSALNEVGGEPARFSVLPDDVHAWATRRVGEAPLAMNALSTHDTKRSEDVRARQLVLSEVTEQWRAASAALGQVAAAHAASFGWHDAETEVLLWQTAVGAWPIDRDRLGTYLQKATREARLHTSWTQVDEAYEQGLDALVAALLDDASFRDEVGKVLAVIDRAARAVTLGQKALHLLLPGVPDVYQGCETVERSLVDPDNRRPVDYDARRARLARLDEGTPPADLDDEKLLVTAAALRLRRQRPDVFGAPADGGGYAPLPATTTHVFGFVRGAAERLGDQVAVLVTRRWVELADRGGWQDDQVVLPEGAWQDLLTGREVAGGSVRVAAVLDRLPVAVLVRADG
jgi:(1->4)-alpha-D-glucan 1-alpha-D-glucosylmutase